MRVGLSILACMQAPKRRACMRPAGVHACSKQCTHAHIRGVHSRMHPPESGRDARRHKGERAGWGGGGREGGMRGVERARGKDLIVVFDSDH
jgi:hypothetical protein